MPVRSPSPEALGILTDEVRKGVGAQTLLRTLGPVYQVQFESLLTQLERCEPELNKLLDLRARISTLRQLMRELERATTVGREAAEQLEQV